MKPKDIYILMGCEESQAVTIEFRKLGFKAFSCDLQNCSGEHPEWHFKMDVFKAISGGILVTESGELIEINKWDMAIFFPTCTYITVSANRWMKDQKQLKSGGLVGEKRKQARNDALKFVARLMNCNIHRIAIENPIGVISSRIFWYSGGIGNDRWEVYPTDTLGGRKPDQIIQPYYFGDEARKTTCLWLKNLPKLFHLKQPDLFNSEVTHVSQGESIEWKDKKGKIKRQPAWYAGAKQGNDLAIRSKERSKTFPGIAQSMATQWGEYLTSKINH